MHFPRFFVTLHTNACSMDNINTLPIGTFLQNGRFRIDQHLGSGGFGNTYQVTDMTSGSLRAMKEFYLKGVNERDSDSRTVSVSNEENTTEFESQKEKFRKEAMRLSCIKHPNIVKVYDLFEENGTAYYTMDYLQGRSLSNQLKTQGHPFTEKEVLAVTTQILDALEAVHQQNIWHLDLKPGNVMSDSNGQIVLIDFGASKQFHDTDGRSLSTSTGLCYTPGYAPTEQIANETNRLGPWTDLYALGATMYNLLTDQTPPSVSAIQDGEGFHFPPTVTQNTQRLIRWLMEPNRNHRPQSVDDVRRFMGLLPNAEIDDNHSSNKKWWLIGALAALLAAIAILLWLFVFNDGKSKRHYYYDDEDDEEYEEEMAYEAEEIADDDEDISQAIQDSIYFEEQRIQEEKQRQEAEERRAEEQRQAEERRAEEQRQAELREQQRQAQEQQRARQTQEPVQENNQDDNRVHDVVEQMPQFPGGDAALVQFLSSNIVYPPVAEENGIQGRVVCSFVVERNGSISDVRVVKSVDPSLDKEAVRVLKSMPRWSPGKQSGSPVRVKYTVPVTFRLQ